MCGIVGIFSYGSKSSPIAVQELIAIRDAMEKRGPDGEGLWLSEDERVGLAHRRLEIIGLGTQGAQPMVLDSRCLGGTGTLVVTFNGEIYNYKELRAELIKLGHRFKSDTDTEVLLHLYEEYGENLVLKLRGMFAFIVYDERKKTLLLFRDHFGIKPLYFSDDGLSIRVASQSRALLTSKTISKSTSDAALAGLLIFGSIPEPLTAWESISSVAAGTFVAINEHGIRSEYKYYSLPNEIAKIEQDDPAVFSQSQLETTLLESVTAHMTSDVEVGVFLSSGIDSSTLLGLASMNVHNLHAITLGFKEFVGQDYDEVPLSQEVSKLYKARHSICMVDQTEFSTVLPTMLSQMDQPSIDGLNTYLVASAAAKEGLKVALSGAGADEFFGGYSTFVSVPGWYQKVKTLATIGKIGKVSRVISSPFLKNVKPKLASVIENGGSLEEMWLLFRSVFLPWELASVLGRERASEALKKLNLEEILLAATSTKLRHDRGRIAALEGGIYLRNQLLRDADWAGMAHSLEIRVPYVDSVALPAYLNCLFHAWSSSKPKLPLAMSPKPSLPDAIINKPKTGFSLPMDNWVFAQDNHAPWKSVPALSHPKCSWARRWSYSVADYFKMI